MVGALFEQNVDILSIFEEMLKPHYILVAERLMNFDFGGKLFASFGLLQGRLFDNFGRILFFGLQGGKLVAFCKSALSYFKKILFPVIFLLHIFW